MLKNVHRLCKTEGVFGSYRIDCNLAVCDEVCKDRTEGHKMKGCVGSKELRASQLLLLLQLWISSFDFLPPITDAQLASARDVANNNNVENRKVYVGNLPWEVWSESEEGARKAVVDSVKSIDGYQVMCKMAVDGKKGRAGGGMMPSCGPVPGIVNTAFHIAELWSASGGSATAAAAAPEYRGKKGRSSGGMTSPHGEVSWLFRARTKRARSDPSWKSLNKDFVDFVKNFNMHCVGKTVTELHALLIDYEKGLKGKAPTPHGFKEERKLSYGEKYLQVGNGVVSLSCLSDLGFNHNIVSNGISVSLNGLFYFSVVSGNDLLGLVHTDVCGPLRHVSRKGASYFLTFTDDFSRYGYVYLLKHKHEPNGVSERRNRTLLDMVRSMFNLTTLPLSFWDYALESAVRILNMVSTKKVDKTPYKIWHGKAPNLSYLKVRGCEAYVKLDSANKLHQRSIKCIFVGYPKETMGYYFYFPPENKMIVARSERTMRAPNRLYLNIKVEDDVVGDIGEPVNYKAAMLDPDKLGVSGYTRRKLTWMVKYTPIKLVWWLKLHSNHEIDYEETFSLVADIRAIRILIAIAAYYDYEIWQMDVKTAFLNGRLDEDIYMEQPEGHDLSNELYDSTPEEVVYMKKVPYASAVGSIMYDVRCTGPDVAFSQNLVSRYQHNPWKLHWVAVKHILKYLRNTRDMFLVYGGKPDTELDITGFCDASWQCDKDDTKSQMAQAEYVVASEAAMEAFWIRKLIGDLGVMPSINKPINMYCDNSAAIIFANEDGIIKGGRTSYSGYPDWPSLLTHQNQPPSGTGSGPGYVNQVPPSYSSSGYLAGTGYNSGGYASAVAAAAQEYPGQNCYRPFMNRLPPIQGGYVDSRNNGLSSGYPTQPNMPPAGPRGPHGWMYQGGHPYYRVVFSELAR
nr:hypothetical protein [Tanacetum cinerariifolium]